MAFFQDIQFFLVNKDFQLAMFRLQLISLFQLNYFKLNIQVTIVLASSSLTLG
jgi:hypothetical protein